MKFKMGDKVRITEVEPNLYWRGRQGEIIEVDRIKQGLSNYWDYEVRFNNLETYLFEPDEMKKVSSKGEQLLFDFMSTMEGT